MKKVKWLVLKGSSPSHALMHYGSPKQFPAGGCDLQFACGIVRDRYEIRFLRRREKRRKGEKREKCKVCQKYLSRTKSLKNLKPIKWYCIVEGSNWADNYAVYTTSVKQPSPSHRPVNAKYWKQRCRFIA